MRQALPKLAASAYQHSRRTISYWPVTFLLLLFNGLVIDVKHTYLQLTIQGYLLDHMKVDVIVL